MSNIQRTLEILHYTNNIRLTNAETAEEAPEREISGMSALRIFSCTAGEGKIIGMYIYACFHTNKKMYVRGNCEKNTIIKILLMLCNLHKKEIDYASPKEILRGRSVGTHACIAIQY